MRLEFKEAREGARRRIAICPVCGSDETRYSRRQYDGFWPRLFKVRPARCFGCGSYFPVSERALIARAMTGPIDLQIPFTPLEHEASERPVLVDLPFPADKRWWWRRRGICRACGSRSVRPTRSRGEEASLAGRLRLKDPYRCLDCNAGFFRLNPIRLLALTLLVLLVLGGLSYALGRALGSSRGSNASPRIKQGQIPPPPPPVFR